MRGTVPGPGGRGGRGWGRHGEEEGKAEGKHIFTRRVQYKGGGMVHRKEHRTAERGQESDKKRCHCEG